MELGAKLVTSQAVVHARQVFLKMEIVVSHLIVIVELLASQGKVAGLTVLWVVKLAI